MSNDATNYRFAVTALPANDANSLQAPRNMAPHPLNYQELPHSPEYFVYNGRLASGRLGNASDDEVYWMVRRTVVLRHTGERPIEVKGPDAQTFLNNVFTRDIGKVKVGRCSYQFACYHDGGLITDGVLMRLGEDRFWYVQADGDLFSWFKAHAHGLDVSIFDPHVFVSQVQGPKALEVLANAVDDGCPERFRYFDIGRVSIAGQSVILSRSGFTNELGWEFYLEPDADARAIGDRILEAGKPFDMVPTGSVAFRTRRIEAGLLSAGSDFNASDTPFCAGLGQFVDLEKNNFIGKDALVAADKRQTIWGLQVDQGVAALGRTLTRDGLSVGTVCSSGWSPFQRCGVAIVQLDDPNLEPGAVLQATCGDGTIQTARVCETPMYDAKREIPRGLLVDVPPATS